MSFRIPKRTPSAYSLTVVAGIAGLVVAATSFLSMGAPAAQAAATGNGSDWGSDGSIASNSRVSVRWDNEGNSPDNSVYRDQRQLIPHTNDKTYFDVASSVRAAYKAAVGSSNGLGGMAVTVSQTDNLVNQGVQIDVSGVAGGTGQAGDGAFVQVMQCWGAVGADGKPDPAATSPDPSTCQYGATGADTKAVDDNRIFRYMRGDSLAQDGDWDAYTGQSASDVPFTAITGEVSGSTYEGDNVFFNKTTTNELSYTPLTKNGSVSRQFEIQTGSEASGLGCGRRSDSTSTASCWLVVVPRLAAGKISDRNWGAISPSIWAQRLQVKLELRDVSATCPGGQSQLLIGGSELLTTAAASWTPGLCSARKIALGFSQYGDEVARNQLTAGSSDAVASTNPLPEGADASYTPLALAAPVVASQIDYSPACPHGALEDVTTESGANDCGYDTLDALRKDAARAGSPITDLRLNARLVAKLLTQSYGCSFSCAGGFELNDWWRKAGMVESLFADPEFRDLNPQLAHMPESRGGATTDAIVEGMRSDSASAIWSWILGDVAARSFLEGCPDTHDHVINPYYSTRSYSSCEFRASEYEKRASVSRAELKNPAGYADAPAQYPPDGSPYPLTTWFEAGATTTTSVPKTMVDVHPRVDNMAAGARTVFRATVPANSEWCAFVNDITCTPAPGKYRDPKVPQVLGERHAITIADSASAARYQLPTALLCDETGNACVGADTASIQLAAGRFEKTPVKGVVGPAATPDYKKGAYPLALPVYGIVSSAVSSATAKDYAAAFSYMTTTGQKPGFESGELPPGYAPLTPALAKQAAASVKALRSGAKAADSEPDAPAPAAPTPDDADDSTPEAPPVAEAPTSAPAPTASATPAPVAATFTTPITPTPPQLALPVGLGIAIAAGILAPFLRRRTRIRVRR